jgi:hypothetical protein
MSEEGEEKENFIEKLNKQFTDFVGSVFGIEKFMEFSDDVIEKLNLNENEQVIKARDSVEDLLKQAGLLKEDEEEEEF